MNAEIEVDSRGTYLTVLINDGKAVELSDVIFNACNLKQPPKP